MKFAHLADVHLGGWREPTLRDANSRSFCAAIERSIKAGVDFVLIAGDLFNTSLPSMDALKVCVQKLKELKDCGIPVYLIPGSHDFSPSGKTMIDILEHAGLAINVARGDVVDGKLKLRFTVDAKTGCKIVGLFGKKGGLEKHYYYELLKEHLEAEAGPKIFMFHSPIAELKPEELAGMDAMPLSLLPQGFDYYAGGHVHVVQHEKIAQYPNVVYPGPTFPNNFAELEKLECGTFVIWDNGTIAHQMIKLHPVVRIEIDAHHKTAAEVEGSVQQRIEDLEMGNAIVLMRIAGTLKQGKPADIPFAKLSDLCSKKGALVVLKNTNKLESTEFEEIKVSKASVEDIEEALLKEHAGKLSIVSAHQEIKLAQDLMRALSAEKDEGERVADFEKRISSDVDRLLGLDEHTAKNKFYTMHEGYLKVEKGTESNFFYVLRTTEQGIAGNTNTAYGYMKQHGTQFFADIAPQFGAGSFLQIRQDTKDMNRIDVNVVVPEHGKYQQLVDCAVHHHQHPNTGSMYHTHFPIGISQAQLAIGSGLPPEVVLKEFEQKTLSLLGL